jgi:23S rRNA pseudouridine2457 synthase
MAALILFNKPFGVLCQFTSSEGKPTLKDYIERPGFYPAGRLDTDSEGLVALTDDGILQARIADPRHKLEKVYWAQVEGVPTADALESLARGIDLEDFTTLPARVQCIEEPAGLWARLPPIRVRKAIPTTWIELVLREGKNRQVRRMTARAGYPTLRLVRARIGPWGLDGLAPGTWQETTVSTRE